MDDSGALVRQVRSKRVIFLSKMEWSAAQALDRLSSPGASRWFMLHPRLRH